jgi:GT2 family glycosyltransferase
VTGVSVVVSNFNGAKYLPKLLETLRAQRDVRLDLIVVDRHSTDDSASILTTAPDVRVVQEPPQSGLVTGYAVGAAHARESLVFFCNEDMWFAPDCLARLAGHFSDPSVGAADPWQWTYDGAVLIHAGTKFVPARRYMNGPEPERQPDFTVEVPSGEPIPFACCGAVMVRKVAYDAVGGWDRSFFLDGEDVDLFIRFWQAGWRVVAEPAARVYHAVSVSNAKMLPGQVPVSRRRYESARSSVLVMAVKYLPLGAVARVAGLWLGAMALRAARGRWSQARADWGALREFIRRLPDARQYRRRHAALNRAMPVTKFFRTSEFQR